MVTSTPRAPRASTSWRRAVIVAALVTAAVAAGLASACQAGNGTAPGPTGDGGPGVPAGGVLSIAPIPAHIPPLSGQEVRDAIQDTYNAGARGYSIAYRWSELESSPGVYNLTPLQGQITTATGMGFTKIYVNIQVINTNRKETPADLMSVAWDSPTMLLRFRQLLDAVMPILGANVSYFATGNEVDAWLGPNNEWAAYQTFFTQARDRVRTLTPGLPVGVATIFDGARGTWKTQVQALNALADIAIYTYYGNDNGFQALPPSSGAQALHEMVTLAAGKPVIVQELGQSSSAVNGGSDDLQARFFATSLAAWDSIGGTAIPFLSQFGLYDFPPALCDQLLTYYGTGPNTPFREYLCHLGLRRQDGTAKPAFDSVKAFGNR